jgi:hypothetical protein
MSEVVPATNKARAGRWTQLWTQTRGEREGDRGTKARPRPYKPRRGVTNRGQAILGGTPPEVFETAPRGNGSSGELLWRRWRAAIAIRLAVSDHNLPEMAAALEMPVGLLGLGEGEGPIDNGMEAVHDNGSVHRLEIGTAPDADRAERNAAAG